jgi:YbbR domain-containing protein
VSRGQPPRRPAAEASELAREALSRTWQTVRRTPGLFVLSLVIATTLWVIVTDEENPTRVDTFPNRIPVQAVNVGPGLAVANTLPSVDVRVSAPEEGWDRMSAANFRAYVDLNGLDAREQNVAVTVELSGVRGGRVIEVSPASVVVNLEDFVTREVPIDTRVIGTLPRGYELQSATPDRLTVNVSGPESLVALVSAAVADVNVTGLTVDLPQSTELVPRAAGGGDVLGVTLDPPAIAVNIAIEQTTLRRPMPVTVEIGGQPAAGYRIAGIEVQPATLTVEGTFEVLQGLDTLTVGRVNVDGASETLRVAVPVTLPEGLAATVPDATVVAIIAIEPEIGTASFAIVPELADLQPDMAVELDIETVTVVVEGPLPVLNNLAVGSIRVRADASSITTATPTGTIELPLSVTVPEGVTVREVRPEVLSVTLVEP